MRLSESGSVHESDLPTYGTHCKTEVAGVNANESGEWGVGGQLKESSSILEPSFLVFYSLNVHKIHQSLKLLYYGVQSVGTI